MTFMALHGYGHAKQIKRNKKLEKQIKKLGTMRMLMN